jgi:glycosyltransferase involved in cell wall biosynthesis
VVAVSFPNAVDFPVKMPDRVLHKGLKTAIFLSRLHPGKGLLTLAEAWAKIKPKGWQMKVIGPDSYGHKKEVIDALSRLGIKDDWVFVDELDDRQKWNAYRSADLLVHPSVSENFGITIVEGLAAELPVIATKGTPWAELEERKCGWWIDIGVEPLANALKDAVLLSPDELQSMGKRGRKLVEEKYSWDAVFKTIVKGYKEVLDVRA